MGGCGASFCKIKARKGLREVEDDDDAFTHCLGNAVADTAAGPAAERASCRSSLANSWASCKRMLIPQQSGCRWLRRCPADAFRLWATGAWHQRRPCTAFEKCKAEMPGVWVQQVAENRHQLVLQQRAKSVRLRCLECGFSTPRGNLSAWRHHAVLCCCKCLSRWQVKS